MDFLIVAIGSMVISFVTTLLILGYRLSELLEKLDDLETKHRMKMLRLSKECVRQAVKKEV